MAESGAAILSFSFQCNDYNLDNFVEWQYNICPNMPKNDL